LGKIKLLGRAIANVVTQGAVSANPKLDSMINHVIQAMKSTQFDFLENKQSLESLARIANNDGASSSVIEQLREAFVHEEQKNEPIVYANGVNLAKDVSTAQVEKKARENGFLVVNNPHDPESFSLGTFAPYQVTIKDDATYECAESAYRAQKYANLETRKRFVDLSGLEAFNLDRELQSSKEPLKPNWDRNKEEKMMKEILKQCSLQRPQFKERLLASGSSYLVSHSTGGFWGDGGDGMGENRLGKLLMELRKELGGSTGVVSAPPEYFSHYQLPHRIMLDFKVCTYNLGASWADYIQLMGHPEPLKAGEDIWSDEGVKAASEAKEKLIEARKKLQKEIAENLFTSSQSDVFCLQEVQADNSPLLKIFSKNGFEIIRPLKGNSQPDENSDTALAINKKKFKDIKNLSYMDALSDNVDFSMATAIDSANGKKVAFVSGHISGFPLENLSQLDDEIFKNQMRATAESGDNQIKGLLQRIKETCEDCDIILFGGDMNASPDIYKERFALFEDAGFETSSPSSPSALTTRPDGPIEREKEFLTISKSEGNKALLNLMCKSSKTILA
jgi:predicted NAD-dependent protein-ADP-ribosyltransferase YbiA (DUF1768 family)